MVYSEQMPAEFRDLKMDSPSPSVGAPGLLALLALPYVLLGALGLLLGSPSPVFPSAGLALAALLWFGNRALPGLWVGALVLNLGLHWLGEPWLGHGATLTLVATAAIIATGASLQAWWGSWLVRRWQGEAWQALAREQDTLRFLLLGGVLAGLVSASVGTAGLGAFGQIGVADLAYTWWTWYVGDVIGILVFAPLTLALLERRDPLWRDRRRRILAPLLITLALAVMAFHGAGQWEVQERQARLAQVGEALARDLDNRLHTHREVLSGLRHFIEAKPDLSFAAFEQFTRATLADNPDLLALNFNPLVRAAEREAFEARMSQKVPTGRFQILDRDAGRRPVPAGMRPEYAPVTYIVPWEPSQVVLGFDNFSEPVRRAATERASHHRRLAVAAPIDLVQEEARRLGMLEMLAVEDRQATDAAGRPRLLGFVVAVVRIDQLITLATQGKIPAGLQLQVTDAEIPAASAGQPLPEGAEDGVIYRPDDFLDPRGASRHPGDQWQGHLRVGDRDWHLTLIATPAYLQQYRSWAAWGVGVVGLVFAALLQILLLGYTGRAHLTQLHNAALEAAEARLRELNATLAHRVAERTAELRDLNLELNRLATTDSLTGAWNRRYFEQAADLEIARADRYGEPLALLMFDIDHFKLLNDTHGHPVGDRVLVELVQRVRPRLRTTDVLARWGGEEFVVLLPHCGREDAIKLAEKLRHLIATEPFPPAGPLTASFGVADFQAGETLDTWLKRVDDALYAAKAAGRNRVSLHQG
jgi:diguanylate cyclase (GGDEF)-like protein